MAYLAAISIVDTQKMREQQKQPSRPIVNIVRIEDLISQCRSLA